MRYRNRRRYRNPGRRLGGLIVFVIIMIAIFSGGIGSHFFLSILMIGLAFATLFGSFFTLNPRRIYGGLYGFVWFLGLALCFAIGFWPWILLPIVVSALLGILARPLIAALLGLGIFSMLNRNQAQPMYTPPMQPYQPPVQPYQPPQQQPQYYQPYGEGYQPPTEQPPLSQEDGAQYQPYYHSTPSPQYEQPQSQYPQQELPPQQ